MSFKRLTFSLGALALTLIAASQARAQTCTTSNDCHKGFVCVQNSGGTPTPAPAPATAADAGPAKMSALVAPSAGGYCQAAECASDSECGPNMVCHTETYSRCTGGTAIAPCAPNTDCGSAKPVPVDQPTCTDVKTSHCAFTWQLPCSADTDCGAGFNCMPTVSGSCSGSAGTGAAGTSGTSGTGTGFAAPATGGGSDSKVAPPSGGAPVPPDQTCTTTTTFPGYCQPKATTCASNTDCPTDWTCAAQPTRDTPVSNTHSTSGAAGSSGATMAGGGTAPSAGAALLPAPGPSPTPVIMVCTSPYSSGIVLDSKGGDPRAPAQGGTGTGSTGGTGAGGGPGGAVPPSTPSPTHETAGNTSPPNAGCAVAGGSSPGAFLALALLGLVLARRRR